MLPREWPLRVHSKGPRHFGRLEALLSSPDVVGVAPPLRLGRTMTWAWLHASALRATSTTDSGRASGVGRRASGVGRRASGVGRSGTGDGWPGKQQGATGLHRGCSTERGLERPVGRAIRLPSAGPRCDGYTRWSGSIAHRAPGPGQPPRSAGPSNGGQRECLRPAGLFSRASSPHASRRHTPSCPSRQTSTRRPRSPRRASRVSPSRPACPGTSPTPRQPGPRR